METNKKLTFPVKLLPLFDGADNAVICPYGIKTVVSMVAEGANDESLEQILKVFGFDSLEELRESVLDVQNMSCAAFRSENSLELEKGEANLKLLPKFKQIMEERYNASVVEGVSAGEAALLLRNVADFKAEWFHRMERDATHETSFRNADGSEVYPAFLSVTNDYPRYYNGEKVDGKYTYVNAVAVPYQLNYERIPYELVLVEGNKELTTEVLEDIFSNLKIEECRVVFPEFSIKNNLDLVPVMEDLGLKAIFNQGSPVFDKITTQPLYAESLRQKAEIAVDEKGTVAKAVTECDCHIGDYFEEFDTIVFDKPFHYFLRNTTTGEIIFMGKVNKLENCERQGGW